MKTVSKLIFLLTVVCIGALVSACSDDPDAPGRPNPKRVFTTKMPKTINDFDVVTNNAGLLVALEGEGAIITFEYGKFKRDQTYNAKMDIRSLTQDYQVVYYLKLNHLGFATEAYSEFNNGNKGRIYFDYDDAGHLVSCSFPGSGAKINMTYTNGHLHKTIIDYGDDLYKYITLNYDDNCRLNIGNLMLYDEWGLGLGYISYAYYAGMLGTSTPVLPSGHFIYYHNGVTTDLAKFYPFKWQFDQEGYPTEFMVHSAGYICWDSFTW